MNNDFPRKQCSFNNYNNNDIYNNLDAPQAEVGVSLDTMEYLPLLREEGTDLVTFVCKADGYPSPTLHWEFNGGELPTEVSETLFVSPT